MLVKCHTIYPLNLVVIKCYFVVYLCQTTLTVWPVGKPIPFIVKHEENNNKRPKEESGIEEEEEAIEKEIMNLDTEDEPVQIPSTTTLKQFLAQKIGGSEAQPPKDLILSCWIRLSVIGKEAEFEIPNGLVSHQSFARQAQFAQSSGINRLIYDSRWETDTELAKRLTAVRTFTPDIIPGKFFELNYFVFFLGGEVRFHVCL